MSIGRLIVQYLSADLFRLMEISCLKILKSCLKRLINIHRILSSLRAKRGNLAVSLSKERLPRRSF
jgi:hypothetical protein